MKPRTGLALIPIHNQRPLERVAIRLQPPHRIRLVLRPRNDLARRTPSTQVIQYVLELVGGGRFFCYIELKLCALGFGLGLVGRGLVFCGVGDGLRICLLEEGEDAGRGLVGGLVEEGYDILCAVL
jgi:hypothetical protein